MNQPSSNFVTHDGRTIGQRLKRWSTAGWVLTLTGFLLIALYSLLNPKTFTVPAMAQSSPLIKNGQFNNGLSFWTASANVSVNNDVGYPGLPSVQFNANGANIRQSGIEVSETGIYQLSYACQGTHWFYNSNVTHELSSSDPNTTPSVVSYACAGHQNNNSWYTKLTNVLLVANETYTLTLKRTNTNGLRLDNVVLQKIADAQDLDTGVVLNGEFIGSSPWAYSSGAVYEMDKGPTALELGDVTFNANGATISQTGISVATPGVYRLTYQCQSGHASYGSSLQFKLLSSDVDTFPVTNGSNTTCEKHNNNNSWYTKTHQLLLVPGDAYILTFKRNSNNYSTRLDNVALIRIADVEDLDTGIVANGIFVGSSSWAYSDNTKVALDKGRFTTQLGAVSMYPKGESITQTNIAVTGSEPMTYRLSLNAVGSHWVYWINVGYTLDSSNPLFQTVNGTTGQFTNSWITHTEDLLLLPGIYTLTVKYASDGSGGQPDPTLLMDNISLLDVRAILKDEMDLGKESDSCNGVSNLLKFITWWTDDPINTRNGNLSHQETDLSIPVAGCRLEFFRSYASQGVGYYTTTMGYGWTHNYDMRLHFDNTLFPNSVDFQVGNGSRMPFIDQGDGTYRPYAGVTGEMSQVGSTYVITGSNQKVYTFNANGRILSQADPHGNTITFSYSNGLLTQVGQGSRTLTYSYDGQDRLVHVADHTGRTITLTYNANNELRSATNPLGQTTVYTYTTAGSYAHLLAEVGDASGRRLMLTAYDTEGRATQQWDGAGRLIVDIDFSQPGAHVSMEDGVTMTHAYDGRNTLIGSTYTCSDGTPGCGTGSGISYDGNFRQNDVADGNGHGAVLDWNAAGSNLETVQNALGDETHMGYDQYNNLTRTIDARSNATQYTYGHPDFPTFLTSMTDALGNTTLYTPTTLSDGVPGLLKATRDANGRVTTYQYNTYGQVTQQVVAAGTPEAITTTYGYDALGRLILTTQTSATESHTSLSAYDAGDRLVATIANWTGSNPAAWQNECAMPAPSADANVCTRYGYDAAGRPISSTNALGQTDLTFYDGAGRVVTSVVNYDGSTAFTALCTDFTNPDPEYNLCALTGYDAYGRVVTSTDSLGRQRVTEYDSLGRVSRSIVNWVDGLFNASEPDRDLITTYSYDAVGNVLVVTDPLGRQRRTFYDALNRVAGTMENWDGSTTLADCASLPRERDENICTQYQYDEVGNTIIVTNTLSQTSRTFYDALNRVVATVENWQPGFTSPSQCQLAPNNSADQNICTLYGYDDAGNQVTTTNALNQTTRTVYDAANRPFLTVANWDGITVFDEAADCQFPPAQPDVNVCTLTSYDALGRPIAAKDPLGHLTAYAYDGLGRVVTTTHYLDGVPVTSHTTYDALGNRLATTDAEGHTTTTAYDSLNRLVQTTTAEGITSTQAYNAAGWVITTTNGLGYATVVGYDLMGRRVTITDAEGNTTTYQYDALGNQTAMIDAEGVRTGYVYDDLNRLVKVVENKITSSATFDQETNVETRYFYDALGNRLRIQHLVLESPYFVTSTITTYDALNRPILVRDAIGNETHTSYNALGLQTVMTDGNDAVTTYNYDNLNRLITTTYQADAETVAYSYNAAGNRLAMIDKVGMTTYSYDDLFRLITVTNPLTGTVVYSYDLAGNRTGITYPDNKVVTYTHDSDNRLIQVDDWAAGVTTYAYDAVGQLITTTLPNGVRTVDVYDKAGRLLRLTHTAAGVTQADYQYALDGLGNRQVATETLRLPDNSLQTTTITYSYDPLYRLTAATYSGDLAADYSYVYDTVGNMTAYTETVGITTTVVNRTFNAANQLQTATDTEQGTTSFYYDGNGNLVMMILPASQDETQHYHYNQRNLLVKTERQVGESPTVPVASFVYDGDANRVQQVDHTSATPITTTYTNDIVGLSQVLVSSNGVTTTHNLFGLDLIHVDDGSETRTLLADGLGSGRVEMVDGTIDSATTYEPYGKVLAQSGASGTVYGFTGEQYDALTGQVYLRARYYNPGLKVFSSRDPFPGWAQTPASQHGYSYAHNNPINYTDPTGNCVFFGIDTLICLGAGIGFLANMTIQTIQNMQDGMPFLEAIYHENIDWTSVAASTAAGGTSGALAPFIPAGTTLGTVLAYGALDGFISGLIEQSILNQLLCREWDEGLLETGVSSAVAGALTAGIFDMGGRAVSGIFRSLDGNRFVPNLVGGGNVSTSKFLPSDLDDLRIFAERARKANNERGFSSFGETWAQLGEMGSQNLYITRSGNDVTGAMLLGGSKGYYGDVAALEVKFLEGIGGGSGTALLQTAHQVSKQRGLDGAVMLYSSNQAIPFYKRFPGHIFDPSNNMFYWSPKAAKVAFGG